MKRRRQVLQVSTFPFLAVLLCAMGSLILLLLVIDRRAKAVSRAKAERAAAHALAADAQVTAARKAEWEQRRRELHDLLAREEEEIVGQVKAAEGKNAAVATAVATAEAHFRELRQRLEAEAGRLLRKRDELSARRASLSRIGDKAQASKHELTQLAAELDRLEQTLRDLRALREREKQTYSLIPYFGRRGDDRRPIYVECTAAGLVFHPERLVLEGPRLEPMTIRTEVERRIARQRDALPVAAPGAAARTEPSAYLLMLVRPDGILSYYRTQSALAGLTIDFGYEFVEQDWILDFSADDNAAAAQPWMTANQDRKLPPSVTVPPPPAPRVGPAGAVRGGLIVSGQRAGEGAGNGPPGTAPGAGGAGVAFGGPGTGPGGFGLSGGSGGNATGDSGAATRLRPQFELANAGGPPGGNGTGPPGGGIGAGLPGGPSFTAAGGGGQHGGEGTGTGPSEARRGPVGVVFGGSDSGPAGFGPPSGLGYAGNGTGGTAPQSLLETARPGESGNGNGTGGTGPWLPGAATGGPSQTVGGGGGIGVPGGMNAGGPAAGPGGTGAPGTNFPTNSVGGPPSGDKGGTGVPGGGAVPAGAGTPGTNFPTNSAGGPPSGDKGGTGVPGGGAVPAKADGATGTDAGPWIAARRAGTSPSAFASDQGGPPGSPGNGPREVASGPGGTGPAQGPRTSGEPGTGPAPNAGPGTGAGPATSTGRAPGSATAGTPNDGVTNAPAPGTNGSAGGPSGGTAATADRGAASGVASAGDGTAHGLSSSGEPGGSGGSPPPRILQSDPPLAPPPTRPARTAPPPLSRLIGNRDWPIAIEFRGDIVWLRPSGLRVAVESLGGPERGEQRLAEAVQKLVADRQATVRPGEAPYRPVLRFLVHPDGLRGYYLAFPLLEALRIPMTRENVQPPPPAPRTIDR